ncbi:MAG: primosomal protein N' (replication factor Y) [Phycisphaerales bacterium]
MERDLFGHPVKSDNNRAIGDATARDPAENPEVDYAGVVFARVAVERGLDRAAGLTYRGPEGLVVGDRVEVPLGRGNKTAGGFVVAVGSVELLDGFDPAKVKPITRVTGARLLADLVELGRWMSDYYVCPIGMVLATMLPAAVKAGTGQKRVKLIERVPRQEIEAKLGGELTPESMTKTVRAAWEAIEGMEDSVFPVALKTLAAKAGASNAGPINRLVEQGLLREIEITRVRAPEAFWEQHDADAPPPPPPPTLSAGQLEIVTRIGSLLGEGYSGHVLRGVTGSGKTEVYLRLIERVLDAGKTALVLVPEIALTPQTAGRFLERFADRGVAVLHSGLTASQRHRQWASAASGAARVVVGARSAVFGPLPELGLIVVDEEHDSSYKQDQLPRYHARDVAVVRAQGLGIPVILGSATPSMESWANAKRGRYSLWELNERVGGASMPHVEIVDIAKERASRREGGGPTNTLESIGPTLAESIEETINGGWQVLLLLNRRGFASYIACPAAGCGWSLGCDQCDVSMVVHKKDTSRGYARCHHCLAEQALPRQCPICNGRLIELGSGTQRVEKEIESRFGTSLGLIEGETFARVDSDTMTHARDYFDVLGRFGKGELRLLLGTQMIAKGLDFPGVRLVGVLNADTGLSMPDFRAAERTFQLVSQVAGRAGRRGEPGRVVVQTMNPTEPAIRLAAAHDYRGFAERELRIRSASGLPPITRMARVVVRDESHDAASTRAAELARMLREECGESVLVQGPGPCAVSRVAGQFRFSVEVLARRAKDFQEPMARLRAKGYLKSDNHTAVDVDPVALM